MSDSEQFFGPGERVEVWDVVAREWMSATVVMAADKPTRC